MAIARTCLFAVVFSGAACDGDRDADGSAVSRSALTTDTETTFVETMLLPSDVSQAAKFGQTLAMSGDVLVVSAPSWNLDGAQTVGGVYVFLRDPVSHQWVEQKKLLVPHSDEEWTLPVAVEGDTVAVGSPNADIRRGFQQGAVYIFERHHGGADNWGEVIKISDASVGDIGHFGASVALSSGLLVVGATKPPSVGQVEIFERDRGGPDAWGKVTAFSYNDDGGLSPEFFGVSLAVDGDLILVGASSADVSYYASNDGAAYVFQRDPVDRDRWNYLARLTEPEATLCTGGLTLWEMFLEPVEVREAWALCAQGDTLTDNVGFGGNVALEGDTAVVTGRGFAYVFQHDVSDVTRWSQVARLETTDGAGIGELALDGETLLVGASGTDVDGRLDQGAVHAFERDPDTGGWTQVETLVASDGLSEDRFGYALAFQGGTRVIGAYARNGWRGAVYLDETGEPPPPPPALCQPAFATTDTLEDAGSVTSPSGFVLATRRRALDAPLPIWIHEVAAPVGALPGAALPIGAYYNVGAECTTFTPPRKQFLLGIPVPDSADTTSLGAAILVSASSVFDGPLSGAFWETIQGTYDAERRLYVVARAALTSAGNTLVLTQDPAAASSRRESERNPQDPPPIFEVFCDPSLDPSVCSAQQKSDFYLALMESYVAFRQQGFAEPYMGNWAGHVGKRPYQAHIRPSSHPICADGAQAAYNVESTAISLCIPPAGPMPPPEDLRHSARHELFHAVQHGYPAVRDAITDDWVTEGTAEAAAAWDGAMHRVAGRAFRRADITLTQERVSPETAPYPYEAQDFWVHLFRATGSDGVRRNHPLGALVSFFQYGGSTASVADRLQNNPTAPAFDDLGREYWAWAKNQVMEKTDVDFDGQLPGPCQIEDLLIGETVRVDYPGGPDDPPFVVRGQFESGLQTDVIEITITREVSDVTVLAEGGGDDLAYKVYLGGESDCSGPDATDGARTFDEPLPAGAVIFIVLANKRVETGAHLPLAYEVRATVP